MPIWVISVSAPRGNQDKVPRRGEARQRSPSIDNYKVSAICSLCDHALENICIWLSVVHSTFLVTHRSFRSLQTSPSRDLALKDFSAVTSAELKPFAFLML